MSSKKKGPNWRVIIGVLIILYCVGASQQASSHPTTVPRGAVSGMLCQADGGVQSAYLTNDGVTHITCTDGTHVIQ